MPGRLYGGRLGSRSAVSSRVTPPARQPLAHDAQFGLGLHGEIEPHGAVGTVGGAADTEATPPLCIGPGPLRNTRRRIGEHLPHAGTPPEPGERLVRL